MQTCNMKRGSFFFKRDKFKHARGGYSRLLDISCRSCETPILVYQKDGPGNLRRLYMDRIFSPEKLTGLEKGNVKNVQPLRCPKCSEIVGTPYIYKKENRLAFRLYQDAVVKKVKKINA